jgi:hypothetical protein
MKKILFLFMAVLTLGVTARADDGDVFSVDNLTYKVLSEDNSEVAIVGFKGWPTDLIIQPYVTYLSFPYLVTQIGGSAFYFCGSLTSVTIPNSVTKIGSRAFSTCRNLTSVTIPNSVTEIGEGAFVTCENLTSVTIPNSVTKIGESAFSTCYNLTSVTIPNSVTEIGISAFSWCKNLKEILVDNGNASYTSFDGVLYNKDKTCLNQCPAGKESVNFPSSVTEFSNWAFAGCSNLTSITIPNSVTKIGSNTFYGCDKLTLVTISNSVTEIQRGTFSGCTSLTSVTLPNSVTTIEYEAFKDCKNLKEILVDNENSRYTSIDGVLYNKNKTCLELCPEGKKSVFILNSVTEIGWNAFQFCEKLTSITIPGAVTEIRGRAFSGCKNLKTIYALSTTPPTIGYETFLNVPTDAVIYIPNGKKKAYYFAEGWSSFNNFIEMSAFDLTLNESSLSIEEGKTNTLIATVTHDDDVTIESETWVTSNPKVATVDDGVVTAVGTGSAIITYIVVNSYGCLHTESCEVTVTEQSGIEVIEADGSDAPVEYYNLNGVRVANPEKGLYIKRQGSKATKVLVK